ncbi:Uncharacterised protein [Serratia ficaria]|nr:Uncharacterised protein [Serratia ficaria]
MNTQNRRLDGALLLGALALLALPWYSQESGFFDFSWLSTLWRDRESAPLLWQMLHFQRPWLAPYCCWRFARWLACGPSAGCARSC